MITKEELIKVLDILDYTYGVNDGGIGWTDEDKENIAEGIIKQLNPELCPQIMAKEPLTGVTNKINTSEYQHFKSITFYGIKFLSSYNHNYYCNETRDDLILETADDGTTCYYYRIEIKDNSITQNYLGLTNDQFGYGIFDKYYTGDPAQDETGVIELDSELC